MARRAISPAEPTAAEAAAIARAKEDQREALRAALVARPLERRERDLTKWEAERQAEAWMAARRALVAIDPLTELKLEELRARATGEQWAAIEAAVPLEPRQIILLLPGYDPREQAGDCWFDEQAAERAARFFPDVLRHVEGELAGRPFELELWQQAFVMNLFGWKRPDGSRRFREAFLEVPRKNGKTPLCAGIVLLLLLADGELGAQVYAAAGDKQQAALIFRHAAGMVAQDQVLRREVKPYRSGKSLEYRRTGSFFRALSRESKTKHGLNIHGVVVDELHVQPDGELVDTLTSALGTRRQPLVVYVTTRDYDRPSVCNEKEDYARKVRDGLVVDTEYLPCIFAMEPGDDWTDPVVHARVNPNLGISIKPEELARECRKARHSPRERNSFIRLRLNGRTQAEVAWIPLDLWDLGAVPAMRDGHDGREAWIEELGLEGEECWGGLDLSSNRDLSAFVLWFPRARAVLSWLYAPRETAEEREKLEGQSYLAWENEGWITLTPGNVIDYDRIKADILEADQRFQIRTIGFDRFGATQVSTQLAGEGLQMVKFGQGWVSMSPPAKEFERLFLKGQVLHGGHPVLRYSAACIKVLEGPNGNIAPDKMKSSGRIDPLVALLMAIGEAIVAEDDGGDAYHRRGFVRL